MEDRQGMPRDGGGRRILLTGATGFVGQAAYPALSGAGWEVVCATRDAGRASRSWPERHWVTADVGDRDSVARAMEGCDAALYLVHGMASAGDYHSAEVAQAENFSRAAERSGVRRIVYVGGVMAQGDDASEHLRSRQAVGETLRAGATSTIELRASMIIGHGSLSWLIVRDLAARLPLMVLPRWLKSRTEPVGIDDVVAALLGAVDLEEPASACFGIPGPEVLSGREILERAADVLGRPRPWMIEVPLLSPQLSSHWVRFVTRADWAVAREVVIGLKEDLLSQDGSYWQRIGHAQLQGFDQAAELALLEEAKDGTIGGPWGTVERLLATALRRAGGG